MSALVNIDLREGFRIEVQPLVLPQGQFEARLYGPTARRRWKQVGPMVVADTPEQAARDLLTAMNEGLLHGVSVAA